ncbi:MAG: sugar ABC transporter permease [Micrococcales bacterium]|nr:sugar ABC transporter permease [Micrococcales bacterium]
MRREPSVLAGYGFVAPNFALLGLFVFVPLAGAVVISLQRTNGFGGGVFAGLDNYARLFADPLFWRSAGNTVLFTAIITPLSMGLGLLVALLLDSVLPARALFRSAIIVPMAVSGVATALAGRLIFDENSGVLDLALRGLGLPSVSWQSNGVASFASVVAVTVWWRVGFNMIVYLAGLQGIGVALKEAALLDGATAGQRLRFITVPLLGPTSFFLLIVNVIFSFSLFDIVFVMTGGGPADATSVLVTYAYDQGFVSRDQGYAAAIGVVLLLATLVFTAVQWRGNRGRDVTE